MTEWTARVAFLLYAVALARHGSRATTVATKRALWTLAYAALAMHVLCAFALIHGWSHTEAYKHTARVMAEWTGWAWGGGVYWNYVLLGVWGADIAWWWLWPAAHSFRPRWYGTALHAFLFFMYVQAAIVFAPSPWRWFNFAVLLTATYFTLRRP